MQKSHNLKNKLFLAFFVSLTATCLKAATIDTITINDNINPEQLTTLLNSMNEEDQKQFLKLLNESANVSNGNKKFNKKRFINDVVTFFDKLPYAKICGLMARLMVAVLCWEIIQPGLKRYFEEGSFGHETAAELPKVISGALIIDGIKDFLKEIREVTETKCHSIYTSITSTNESPAAFA